MEVYRFQYEDKERNKTNYLEVKKSLFRNVPLCTIVRYMEDRCRMEIAFTCIVDPSVRGSGDNETILINDIEPYNSLDDFIQFARNRLVFYNEYIKTRATHINFNICGFIFNIKIATALRDPESDFSRIWKGEGNTFFPLDEETNLKIEDVCLHTDKDCSECEKNFPVYTTKEKVLNALARLETGSILELDDDEMSHETELLYELGLIGKYSKLE